MPITPTYPGVYVEEVPSGVRTITGVSTSIATFIGRAKMGPMFEPVLCLNLPEFERTFSSEYAGSDLARAVRLFFMNGGTQCYVMRIADGATCSEVTLEAENGSTPVLRVIAKSAGLVGNTIRLAVTYNGLHPESTFNLEVFRWTKNSAGAFVKTDRELWNALSMDPDSTFYAQDYVNHNSNLVELEDLGATPASEGYSQSGRAIPDASFEEKWRALIFGIGEVVHVTDPWTSTSTITTSGSYTGTIDKTYTFTVVNGGVVGTASVTIDWSDGTNSGTIDLTGYGGNPETVAEGLQLTFTSSPTDELISGEKFTVDVGTHFNFRISVDSGSFVNVDLSALTETHIQSIGDLQPEIEDAINSALTGGPVVTVEFVTGPLDAGSANTKMLKIKSANGDVKIESAASNDLAIPLMLGAAYGGIEVSRYAQCRPAPCGVVFNLANLVTFAELQQTEFDTLRINSTDIDLSTFLPTASGDKMYRDGYTSSVTDHCDGVREKWSFIVEEFNKKKASDTNFKCSAEVWGSRLALIPGGGNDNSLGSIETNNGGQSGTGTDIGGYFTKNVRYYSLGASGTFTYQGVGVKGFDGYAPTLANYRNAFEILDKKVNLFNLMILPSVEGTELKTIWGLASVFCQKRRAFLLIDAPASWVTVQKATSLQDGVNSLRVGLVTDHSAIFYPRLKIQDNGLIKYTGASGAIAGLMARIDSTRGVWKAPAGTEATIRDVVGVEFSFCDDEIGILNPKAINTLRLLPEGIANWGARTMAGFNDSPSEYKYIPVRRLALFIEESLYRGLKWAVFEPNDEPLWSQIRLNVGAFMHNLFQKGAFQGTTAREAYRVKCDKETTTQTDINNGIVNILVGFAPLKPAEFIFIKIQQMAGQTEV